MKKICKLLAVGLASVALLGVAGCGGNKNVTDKMGFAGDLQKLYGGENGYPQAVLVAKKSVIESDGAAVSTLLSCFENSATYLTTHSGTEISEALASKYPSGQKPSFNANNLTADVIKNCSVKFTRSTDCKTRVNAFLDKLIAIDASFTSTVSDAFYYTATPNTLTASGNYQVYAPDGAPALSLVSAIATTEGEKFSYHVVAGTAIAAQVTGENPAADFCVLPVNVASKLLGSGEKYQMLGTVTNGNMYFLAAGDNPALTADNLATALKGKTVGVVQLANVPGLTLRAVLEEKGIAYEILGNDVQPSGTDKVYLKAIADAATGVTPAGGCDYYLCPEPAATAKLAVFQK